MAIKFIDDTYLTAIANAIRSKLGGSATYKPSEMATAIGNIESVTINNQNKTVHPSASDQTIEADTGYIGLGQVSVKKVISTNLLANNIVSGVTVKIGDEDDDDSIASIQGTASGGITPTGTKQISITSNGTTTEDVTSYANAEITVSVSSGSGWVDVTPDLSNGVNGTGSAHTYSNGALRVYSTSNGTYRSYDVPITLESGKKYRIEFTLANAKTATTNTAFINESDGKIIVGFQKADSSSYAFEATPSELTNWTTAARIRFYCTWSTSAAGDATWTNFKVYKYTGS